MSDSAIALVAGLGGAIIGAAAAIGTQWLAISSDRKRARRQELIELTARLWECADRLWRASQGLEHAVINLDGPATEANQGVRAIFEERRQDSIRRQHEAETEGRFIVAQMRLRRLPIADAGSALLDVSDTYDHQQRDKQRQRRTAALTAYEAAAQQLLENA